ncbi:hypothetical protein J7M07_07235 [bacterium]|nr:hypothetical protein [bacterium]
MNEIEEFVRAKLLVNPELVIVIETHPEAEYSIMIDILDELRNADAKKISLKTMKLGQ